METTVGGLVAHGRALTGLVPRQIAQTSTSELRPVVEEEEKLLLEKASGMTRAVVKGGDGAHSVTLNETANAKYGTD